MVKSRKQKATLNITTMAIQEIVALICSLILPRLILSHFGSAYNGIVTSVTQFLTLIQILTLGVTASTRVALYKSLADKDLRKTSAIVKATSNYMRKIGCILLVYILAIAIVYPLVVHTGYEYFDVAILVVIIGAGSFAEYFFGVTYRTFLLADQCVYISNCFFIVSRILNTIVAVALIECGFSIQIVKLASACVFVLRPILQYIYIHKKYKLIKNIEPDKSALNKRGDAMAHALANMVHDHTDVLVLTIFTDVKIVSVYTVYNLIMNALKKIQMIMTTGTEPIFGDMWAKGEKKGIQRFLEFYEYAIYTFASFIFSVALIMLLPFVALYTKGVHDVEYILPVYAFVITMAFAFQSIRTPYLCLVQGAGKYKETKAAAIAEAVINIVISVALVNVIGIVGVAIGTLVANLYRTFQYAFFIDKNIVKRGMRVVLLRFAWMLLNMALICVPAYFATRNININSWGKWVLVALAVALYGLVVVLISSLIFYRNDMRKLMKTGKSIILRRLGKPIRTIKKSKTAKKAANDTEDADDAEDDLTDIIPENMAANASEDVLNGTELEE